MSKRRFGLGALLVGLAICAAFVAGVVLGSKAEGWWRPPNQHELIGRLVEGHALELLQECGRRGLAGEPVPADDRQKLQLAGAHSIMPVRHGPSTRAVRFEFGGADNHYGLLVTQDQAAPNIGLPLTPIKPDLWYYSEIPPRR
jgi:hypothetical protein